MATAEELLAQMEENPELYADSVGPVNDVIVINAETRTIELPESEKLFGVESDKASERKYFKCPKIVGDNIDLSALNLFINFKNANNEGDIYPIDDVEVDGDYIAFSWKLSKKVTAYKTDASKNQLLSFIFCAKNGEGPENEWNTTICSDGIVLEGLEPGESIVEDNPDIIQYILERLESAGTITPEQISGAVEEYFASNPIEETDPTVPAWAKEETPDKTLSEEGKAADAKEVGDRLGQLSDEKANQTDVDELKSDIDKNSNEIKKLTSGVGGVIWTDIEDGEIFNVTNTTTPDVPTNPEELIPYIDIDLTSSAEDKQGNASVNLTLAGEDTISEDGVYLGQNVLGWVKSGVLEIDTDLYSKENYSFEFYGDLAVNDTGAVIYQSFLFAFYSSSTDVNNYCSANENEVAIKKKEDTTMYRLMTDTGITTNYSTHHVVWSIDGSTSVLYFNGKKILDGVNPTVNGFKLYVCPKALWALAKYVKGYDKALSEDEVATLYEKAVA